MVSNTPTHRLTQLALRRRDARDVCRRRADLQHGEQLQLPFLPSSSSSSSLFFSSSSLSFASPLFRSRHARQSPFGALPSIRNGKRGRQDHTQGRGLYVELAGIAHSMRPPPAPRVEVYKPRPVRDLYPGAKHRYSILFQAKLLSATPICRIPYFSQLLSNRARIKAKI